MPTFTEIPSNFINCFQTQMNNINFKARSFPSYNYEYEQSKCGWTILQSQQKTDHKLLEDTNNKRLSSPVGEELFYLPWFCEAMSVAIVISLNLWGRFKQRWRTKWQKLSERDFSYTTQGGVSSLVSWHSLFRAEISHLWIDYCYINCWSYTGEELINYWWIEIRSSQ